MPLDEGVRGSVRPKREESLPGAMINNDSIPRNLADAIMLIWLFKDLRDPTMFENKASPGG